MPITRAEFLQLAAAAGVGLLAGDGELSAAVTFPDTVLLGGKVVTMDPAAPIVQAVAVKGGEILAVGSDAAIGALSGPDTEQIHLLGRTVTPGLVDADLHLRSVPRLGGYYTPLLPPQVTSMGTLKDALATCAQGAAAEEWILAVYLTLGDDGVPDRWDLDDVAADNPVFLLQQGGQMATVNSRALELAGISAATPDPTGGIIGRQGSGEPTGVLHNRPALDLFADVMPEYGDEQVRAGIPPALALFASFGVTGFHDTDVHGVQTVADYQQVARERGMSLRSTLYFAVGGAADVAVALSSVPAFEDDYCHFAGSTLMIDGQMQTALCHEPHDGVSWQTAMWDGDSFKQAVRALHDADQQVCVRCVGDAAVDLALEAFEEAMNANPRPSPRHRIQLCLLTKLSSTQRIKDLGVVISTQPALINVEGDAWPSILGDARMERIIRTREWLEAGVPVALGTSAPTLPAFSPQAAMAAAIERSTAGGRVIGAAQAMTVDEALRACTLVGAYASREDNSRGSLRPGKFADLAVWRSDPYAMSASELRLARIDLAMVGGRTVFPNARIPRRRLPRR